MVTPPDKFADRFNEALDAYGAPAWRKGRQKYVGDLFSVSEVAARKWMKGDGMPDTKKLPEIAAKLRVSVEWLMGGLSGGPNETIRDRQGTYLVSDDVYRAVAAELKGKYLEAWEEARSLDEAAYLLKLLFKIHGGSGYDNPVSSR